MNIIRTGINSELRWFPWAFDAKIEEVSGLDAGLVKGFRFEEFSLVLIFDDAALFVDEVADCRVEEPFSTFV